MVASSESDEVGNFLQHVRLVVINERVAYLSFFFAIQCHPDFVDGRIKLAVAVVGHDVGQNVVAGRSSVSCSLPSTLSGVSGLR